MRVLVTGATGFIGRALVLRLRHDGHEVVAWVRSPKEAQLGAEVELLPVAADDAALTRALERCDGVVNLAGAPIAGRWTPARKEALFESRVGVTSRLVRAIADAKARPRVLVSGSAVGYYGDCGADPVDERGPVGTGFLARLADAWEIAALAAEPLGLRVVTVRTGVVLGREGGVLARLLPIFRLGLGGPIGRGTQFVSWVHLDDVVSAIVTALTDGRYAGPVNLTAPKPVTNAELTRALGRALRRPTPVRVPAAMLRAALGDGASPLLEGQRAEPARLVALGHRFAYVDLDSALRDVVASRADIRRLDRATSKASARRAAYLARRRPSYVLTSRTELDAAPEEAFAFFARPENLGLMTPSRLHLEVQAPSSEVAPGTRFDVRLKLGPLPLRWTTRIEDWVPGRRFIDSQTRGPYRAWWHEHSFEPKGDRSVMTDRVFYALPFGPLGRIVNRLFVAPALRGIFGFRSDAMRLRFGGVAKRWA